MQKGGRLLYRPTTTVLSVCISERHSIFGPKGPKRAGRLLKGSVFYDRKGIQSLWTGGFGQEQVEEGALRGRPSGGSDQADFSPFAVELARIGAELKNVPDVRQDVVDRLQAQVAAGEYVPQLEQVARSLVLSGFLDRQ